MTELTSFSFENVSVIVDGQKLSGLWEGDDPVSYERNKPSGNPVVGVDGHAVVSRPVDRSRKITIKCMPNSTAHRILTNKQRNIENNLTQSFGISITDVGSGEGGQSTQATIIEQPNVSLGENAKAREWVLFANEWSDNEVSYDL